MLIIAIIDDKNEFNSFYKLPLSLFTCPSAADATTDDSESLSIPFGTLPPPPDYDQQFIVKKAPIPITATTRLHQKGASIKETNNNKKGFGIQDFEELRNANANLIRIDHNNTQNALSRSDSFELKVNYRCINHMYEAPLKEMPVDDCMQLCFQRPRFFMRDSFYYTCILVC